MTKQLSFTKYEKKYRLRLREHLDQAESTQDVRKFFYQIVRDMLGEISDRGVKVVYESVKLTPGEAPGYAFKPELLGNTGRGSLEGLMSESDLGRILKDFAVTCSNRLRRLGKNPEKTESKMWAVPGSRELQR